MPGGRGIVLDYRVRSDNGFLTAGYTRSKFPPWGVDGGRDGSPNYIEFIPNAGRAATVRPRVRTGHREG